ncbi:MAG: LamB/YcsF family protein [Ancalomicrobiaceae bacterium]|nr:LamB/YcsF family protein [Ancalomicrobiaceae bacterium]
MVRSIDLNSDLGEAYGPWRMGDDTAMLGVVTSANLACGGHAGDPETMFKTLVEARRRGVVVGAHPGYADKEGFGRRIIRMTHDEIGRMLAAQIGALMGVAALAGTPVRFVKPHGALANLAAANEDVAKAVVFAVKAVSAELAILAISGTALETAAREAGTTVYSEIFADRGYLPNGQLVPRGRPGALIKEPDAAASRLVDYLGSGMMPVVDGEPIPLQSDSVCVHGDSASAVEMARLIHTRLGAAGIVIKPFIAD